MLERREFLIGCGAAVLTTGLHPVPSATSSTGKGVAVPSVLSRNRFLALLNSRFEVDAPSGRRVLELVAVADGPCCSGLEQFSLTLRDPQGRALEAGTYAVRHPELNGLALYLQPVREDATGSHHAADFSLLTGTGRRA